MYNVIFPIWLFVWWPSWLWLVLIPGNYLVDRLVLRHSLKGRDDRDALCRSHTWKVCLAGFASDFAGSCFLFAVMMLTDLLGTALGGQRWLYAMSSALTVNPFGNIGAFVLTCLGIALAGYCIYRLDAVILRRAGLDDGQAMRSARLLAIVTAPYLFLLPVELFWQQF